MSLVEDYDTSSDEDEEHREHRATLGIAKEKRQQQPQRQGQLDEQGQHPQQQQEGKGDGTAGENDAGADKRLDSGEPEVKQAKTDRAEEGQAQTAPSTTDATEQEESSHQGVDPKVAQKVAVLLQAKRARNISILGKITCNKQYRNPSIYEKLIQRMNIDEFGTNMDPSIYDPHKWTQREYADKIGDAQQEAAVWRRQTDAPGEPAVVDTAQMKRTIEDAQRRARELAQNRAQQSEPQ